MVVPGRCRTQRVGHGLGLRDGLELTPLAWTFAMPLAWAFATPLAWAFATPLAWAFAFGGMAGFEPMLA